MSTILDALRKVERERGPAGEDALDAPTISPVRRRRPFPTAAVVVCAVIGFSAGALLSWWTPAEPPVEVAKLPAPPPPPDVDVPRAPARAQAKPPSAPAARPAVKRDVVVPAAVASAVPPPAAAGAASPAVPSSPPAVALAPKEPDAASLPPGEQPPGTVVAAIDKETALEPSPFGPARGVGREGAAPSVQARIPSEPPRAPIEAPAAAPEPQDLAALVPPVAQEPPATETEMEPVGEPEPEASPETIFDTGRSKPGAPKVALSFLQWSSDPARRFAFISIDGAPSQRVHEGEVAGGLTVAAITPTGVQFKREGSIFVIRPRH